MKLFHLVIACLWQKTPIWVGFAIKGILIGGITWRFLPKEIFGTILIGWLFWDYLFIHVFKDYHYFNDAQYSQLPWYIKRFFSQEKLVSKIIRVKPNTKEIKIQTDLKLKDSGNQTSDPLVKGIRKTVRTTIKAIQISPNQLTALNNTASTRQQREIVERLSRLAPYPIQEVVRRPQGDLTLALREAISQECINLDPESNNSLRSHDSRVREGINQELTRIINKYGLEKIQNTEEIILNANQITVTALEKTITHDFRHLDPHTLRYIPFPQLAKAIYYQGLNYLKRFILNEPFIPIDDNTNIWDIPQTPINFQTIQNRPLRLQVNTLDEQPSIEIISHHSRPSSSN